MSGPFPCTRRYSVEAESDPGATQASRADENTGRDNGEQQKDRSLAVHTASRTGRRYRIYSMRWALPKLSRGRRKEALGKAPASTRDSASCTFRLRPCVLFV